MVIKRVIGRHNVDFLANDNAGEPMFHKESAYCFDDQLLAERVLWELASRFAVIVPQNPDLPGIPVRYELVVANLEN